MKRKREVCTSFPVVDEHDTPNNVFVTQENRANYSKKENYSKRYNLGASDGVEVYKTSDPEVFQLANGTLLKRIRG